jgi:hypothetical protein
LKAPRQLIGKRVKCPTCGGRVDIVGPDPDALDTDGPRPAVADDDPAARSTIAETASHAATARHDPRDGPKIAPAAGVDHGLVMIANAVGLRDGPGTR